MNQEKSIKSIKKHYFPDFALAKYCEPQYYSENNDCQNKMNRSKKDAYLPGLRAPKDIVERANAAFETLGVDIPNFRRRLWLDLIRIAESGEMVAMPARILTAKEEEILKRFRDENGNYKI